MRSIFSSSRLVRLLSDLASVEVDASGPELAERLGLWLDVFDAIKLHAVHQSINTVGEEKPAEALLSRTFALEEEFYRVRTTLMKAITASGAPSDSGKQYRNLVPSSEAAETDAGYAPYHKRYIDQQRQMALRIDALRAYARQALTKVSPQLGQLASLDTVMEQVLGGREQKLLSSVPVLLERRFEHLRKTHQLGLDASPRQDLFGKEMKEVLLAELEVRLQPVVGLIEAFSNEVKKQP